MVRLSDILTVEHVREIHLRIFLDSEGEYLRNGADGLATQRQTEQRIRNVPGRRIARILRAVEPFDESSWTSAWSHFMALGAGTHPWPDANHRTAMVAFAEATHMAFNRVPKLAPADALRLVRSSKDLRDQRRRQRIGRARYYTVAELALAAHPYRRLFASFESALTFTDPHRE